MSTSILVVDDEQDFLDSIARMLRMEGYDRITTLSDPTEVSDTLARERFAVAFLDITMPGIDGLDVLATIKEKSPDTEGIMLTANESVPMVVEAMRRGAYDYVLKPVHPEHLAHVLKRAIERRQLVQSVATLREEVREARQMGQYRLEQKLGAGGMGEVYRASHSLLRRPAAIKLIRTDVRSQTANTPQRASLRFEREAQVTANLKSPHTVQLYDFGVAEDGTFYYVMELLEGLDLETAVSRFGPMHTDRVALLLSQACESLQEAHAAGLVHRDIKPANLYLCKHGIRYDFIKILDFGLVALAPEDRQANTRLTADGTMGCTPAYAAPEIIEGAEVDGRADLYALGCVAFWLLTGQAPFEGRTPMATLIAHVKENPSPPSTLTELEVPPAFEQVVMDCLAKSPEDRPASAEHLAARIHQVLDHNPWTQARARRWWETHRPDVSRNRGPVAGRATVQVARRTHT